MKPELLPCPFCGHAPFPSNLEDSLHPSGVYWRDEPDGFRHYVRRGSRRESDGEVWSFGCLQSEGGCGAELRGDGCDEVLAAWNRRAVPA